MLTECKLFTPAYEYKFQYDYILRPGSLANHRILAPFNLKSMYNLPSHPLDLPSILTPITLNPINRAPSVLPSFLHRPQSLNTHSHAQSPLSMNCSMDLSPLYSIYWYHIILITFTLIYFGGGWGLLICRPRIGSDRIEYSFTYLDSKARLGS